jgi:hypothetical protein
VSRRLVLSSTKVLHFLPSNANVCRTRKPFDLDRGRKQTVQIHNLVTRCSESGKSVQVRLLHAAVLAVGIDVDRFMLMHCVTSVQMIRPIRLPGTIGVCEIMPLVATMLPRFMRYVAVR